MKELRVAGFWSRIVGHPLVIGLALIWLSAGCIRYERRGTTEQTPPPRQASDLAVRLEAARAMTFLNERELALKAVALDAARAGNVQVTKEALNAMSFVNSKDDTAGDCALGLAAAGKQVEALEVARSITFLGKRDAILKQIAMAQ